MTDATVNEWRVRAIITILLTLGFIAFAFLTTILYVNNSGNEALKAVMAAASGALGLAFASSTGMYFGVRSQQPALNQAASVISAQQEHIRTLTAAKAV